MSLRRLGRVRLPRLAGRRPGEGGWDVCRHVSEDVPGMADGLARLAARVRRRPGLAREVGIMAAVTVRNLDDQVKESRRVKTAD